MQEKYQIIYDDHIAESWILILLVLLVLSDFLKK